MNSPRTTYRDKTNAKLLGVLGQDYTGVDAFWIHLGFIVLTITMGWPIIAYFAAGLLLNKKPAHLYSEPAEQKYWQGVRRTRAHRSRNPREDEGRDRRLAEVETFYVSSNPRLTAETSSFGKPQEFEEKTMENLGILMPLAPFIMVAFIVWSKNQTKLAELQLRETAKSSAEKAAQYSAAFNRGPSAFWNAS